MFDPSIFVKNGGPWKGGAYFFLTKVAHCTSFVDYKYFLCIVFTLRQNNGKNLLVSSTNLQTLDEKSKHSIKKKGSLTTYFKQFAKI